MCFFHTSSWERRSNLTCLEITIIHPFTQENIPIPWYLCSIIVPSLPSVPFALLIQRLKLFRPFTAFQPQQLLTEVCSNFQVWFLPWKAPVFFTGFLNIDLLFHWNLSGWFFGNIFLAQETKHVVNHDLKKQ